MHMTHTKNLKSSLDSNLLRGFLVFCGVSYITQSHTLKTTKRMAQKMLLQNIKIITVMQHMQKANDLRILTPEGGRRLSHYFPLVQVLV